MNQPRQLRLLLVADAGADYSAVQDIPLLVTTACAEPSAALIPGADELYDALLLDGNCVDSLDLIQRIIDSNPRLPLILLARDADQEDLALAALEQGADDYLMACDLSSVALCGAIRNARRCRRLLQQRDQARSDLHRLEQQGRGVPLHFAERLRGGLDVAEALADTMDRQLESHPAADMSRPLLQEIECLQRLAEDIVAARKLESRSLVLQRRETSLREIARRVAAGAEIEMMAPEDDCWSAVAICDTDKAAHATLRLVQSLRVLAPGVGCQLVADGERSRLGIRADQWPSAAREDLLNPAPVAPGEAGFERCVALRLLDSQQVHIEADAQTIWLDLPCAPEQLASRWTSWLASDELTPVTLFEVAADAPISWAHALLQQSLTASDLVLPQEETRWIAAVSGGGHLAEGRLRQLTATWDVLEPQTKLQCELIATYHLPLEQQALEGRLQSLIAAPSRRILVLDERPAASPVSRRLQAAGYDVVQLEAWQTGPQADAIVGDADSMLQLEELRAAGAAPDIPVFLLSRMKDQQQTLQQDVRFVLDDEQGQYDELLAELSKATPLRRPARAIRAERIGETAK